MKTLKLIDLANVAGGCDDDEEKVLPLETSLDLPGIDDEVIMKDVFDPAVEPVIEE